MIVNYLQLYLYIMLYLLCIIIPVVTLFPRCLNMNNLFRELVDILWIFFVRKGVIVYLFNL